jgi:uncharacterized protein YciI
MSSRYVYTYFMTDDPARIRKVAPRHTQHWQRLNLQGYSGGPFGDRSGGLIMFVAHDSEEADAAVAGDPFLREGLVERYWVKQWEPLVPGSGR